jgi:O-antigen/teichoic acid export membrane protein
MLKEKAIKGLKWTALSSGIGVVVQLLQIAILARVLDSHAFGIMALATSFIGFSQLFLDMGISNAIIYNQDINKQQLSSLFWLNLGTGWLLFLLIVVTAPLVASFYHEPDLKNVIILIGVSFLIQPLEQQFYALMKKELLFNDIARRDIASKLIAFVIAVILAWNGFGVYSLVISYLSGVVIATTLVVIAGLKFHRPTFHFKLSETKKFLSFGIYQTADSTLNYFNTQIDNFIIGKLLGVEILGIYNIAKNLAMRPSQIINPIVTQVSFPVMAKIQYDNSLLKSVYLRSINYLSSCNVPIYLFICIMAEPIVLVLFGSNWLAAVPSLRLLSIYYLIRSTNNPVGSLLMAKGRVKLSFYWNAAMFIITPPAIYAGSFYGLNGIIYANLFVITLSLFAAWPILIYPTCGATFAEFFGQLVPPVMIGIAILPLLGIVHMIPLTWPLVKILLAAVVLAMAILPLNKFFNKAFFTEAMNMVSPLLKKLGMSRK